MNSRKVTTRRRVQEVRELQSEYVVDKRSVPGSKKSTRSSPVEIPAFEGGPGQVIGVMRSGTPAEVIAQMAQRLDISQDKLFEQLRLPKSTLKGRVSRQEPLAAVEQDRLYRLNRVFGRAVDVLEDEDAARHWIKRENRSLGGEAPLCLLDTEAGYELVLDTLGRIEYGVYS